MRGSFNNVYSKGLQNVTNSLSESRAFQAYSGLHRTAINNYRGSAWLNSVPKALIGRRFAGFA